MLSTHAVRFYFSELVLNCVFSKLRFTLTACLPHPLFRPPPNGFCLPQNAKFRSGIPVPTFPEFRCGIPPATFVKRKLRFACTACLPPDPYSMPHADSIFPKFASRSPKENSATKSYSMPHSYSMPPAELVPYTRV